MARTCRAIVRLCHNPAAGAVSCAADIRPFERGRGGGEAMRVLVTARRRFPTPDAQRGAMLIGFKAWWDFYRSHWQGIYFFAGDDEGFGIAEVADEATFHRMMIEWPLAPYFEIEARPILDVDTAMAIWFDEIGPAGQPRR
jgi:hypothetical protein